MTLFQPDGHHFTPPGAGRLRRLCLLPAFAAALWLTAPALAQGSNQGSNSDPLAGFDEYVAAAVQGWNAPGLAIAVVKDGRTVFAKGYGVRTLGEPGVVDEHTRFAIGSTTKAMTAAAIMMLADEGRLELDDRVIEHLPWFRVADPYLTREITVRDLLTHRAGLGNADFLWYEQDATSREIVERLRLVEPAYSLRSGFIYQNIMYAAAGEVVAAVSGMPWSEFVRTRILQPLEMNETLMTLAETQGQPNVAVPHDSVGDEVRPIENASVDAVAAAGSVWSSVHDMARWLGFLLRDCTTEAGGRLLKPESCSELFEPQAMVGDGFYPTAELTEPHWTTYGLGWFQADYEGRKADFHTGSIDGMVAIAGLLRDEGVGVYVLANRDHVELRHALMYRVFDLYDADPPRDWSTEMQALYTRLAVRSDSSRRAADSQRVADTQPSRPLDRYAGSYSDPLRGKVEVVREANGLRLSYGRLEGPLEHWNYDTFRVSWDTAWRGNSAVVFRLDGSGEVAALELGGAAFRRN